MEVKMDEKIEKQVEVALTEAKPEPTTEPVNTGQAEQPNTESSTEEVTTSDAGLFLSANEERVNLLRQGRPFQMNQKRCLLSSSKKQLFLFTSPKSSESVTGKANGESWHRRIRKWLANRSPMISIRPACRATSRL